LTAAPTRIANGKMNRPIPTATFPPCSLMMTRKFARQGMINDVEAIVEWLKTNS